jgi:quinol monooxygenase YgiN
LLTEIINSYKDSGILKNHTGTDYFKAFGKAIADEGLVSKPLQIFTLEPFSGFDGR